jgi:large subunit ribosomal protein L29
MKIAGILRELREATDEELKARIARLEEELFGHRMKRFTNQLANTMKIRQTRREIARAKTILARRAAGVEKTAVRSEAPAKE